MTKIYLEISKLTEKFKIIAFKYTTDKNKVNESVQELMLYFLNMNHSVLRSIYKKDGTIGIIRYGTVALRRALTSKRSNFYYKYGKYYTKIDVFKYNSNTTTDYDGDSESENMYNTIDDLPIQEEEKKWEKLEKIDKALEDLHWYDKKMFELYYYESNTLDSIAAKTKISRNSIFTTIDKVRYLLKKKLNED